MTERSINQPESKVTSVKRTVTYITVVMSADVASLIRVAIGAAGDGGVDPFTRLQRAKLNDLDDQLNKALEGMIV